LFYELNNYVIISLRNEIPGRNNFERSISEQSERTYPIKSINDTLRVFDTLSFVVFDTILIKVYDTIHVQSKHYKENKVEKHIKKKISFISAEVSPLYQITLNNSDIGNISFLA
jgi:hypothetical protein